MPKIYLLAESILLLSITVCCSSAPLEIWSSLPQTALVVEQYNASFFLEDGGAIFRYESDVYERSPRSSPDIIIAPLLASEVEHDRFEDISRLLPRNFFSDTLYAPLIKDLRFLPLSFDMPLVAFSSSQRIDLPPFVISIDELRTLSLVGNRRDSQGNFVHIRFSPLWNEQFLLVLAEQWGVNFRQREIGGIQWNADKLAQGMSSIQDWFKILGEFETISRFDSRFLLDPPLSLINKKHISFFSLSASDYFYMPAYEREDSDFRWLTNGEDILLFDDIVWAGLLASSPNKKKALQFLQWFFTYETQALLLQKNQQAWSENFGIMGGFSTLMAVNEELFPLFYPELNMRIPHPSHLVFSQTPPQNWDEFRSDVLLPWIKDYLSEEQGSSLEELESQWRNQFLWNIK